MSDPGIPNQSPDSSLTFSPDSAAAPPPAAAPDGWALAPVNEVPGVPAESTPPAGWDLTPAEPPEAPGFLARTASYLTDPANFSGRVLHGVEDPFVGLMQMGERAPIMAEGFVSPEVFDPDQAAKDADKAVQNREEQYQQRRTATDNTGFDAARMLGNVVSPANFMIPGAAPETIAGRLGAAALQGAAISGMQPVEGDDFWSTKAKQLGLGAGAGAAGSAIGSAIFPRMNADAQKLSNAGIPLTPGQMSGVMRRPEEALKSFPILGTFIQSAEGRGTEGFNRAIVNQALEPVGAQLPKNVPIGHEAVKFAQQELSKQYNQVLPGLTFRADGDFMSGLAGLSQTVSELPPQQAAQFTKFVENRLVHRLDPGGTMDGNTIKQVDSELGNFASRYRGSPDAAQQDLGHAISSVQSLIKEALARNNPDAAAQLRNIDTGYAMLARIETAAQRRAGSEGVVTPQDMLSAIRSGDKSVRNRRFAAGDALMQEFAEAANRVLPSRLPDSGTAERAFWGMIAADLVGGAAFAGHLGVPEVSQGIAAGLALGLPYTRAGAPLVGALPGVGRNALTYGAPAPLGGIMGQKVN